MLKVSSLKVRTSRRLLSRFSIVTVAGIPIWALTGSRREARNFATSLFADVSSALIGLKLVVRGEQHLWSRRPAVFVFNHQSKADVVIMARLGEQTGLVQ